MIAQKKKVDRCRANIPKAFSPKPIKNAERHCVPGKITLLKKVRTGWVSHKKKQFLLVGRGSPTEVEGRRAGGPKMEPKWSNLAPKSVKFGPKLDPENNKLEFGGPRAHFGEQLGPRSEPDRAPDGLRMALGGLGGLLEGPGSAFGKPKSTRDRAK